LGASGGFDYRQRNCFEKLRDTTGEVDVVLELVGGDVFRESFKLINPLGRMVVAGFASLDLKKWNPLSWVRTWRDIPRVSVGKMARKSVAVMATHIGYLLEDEPGRMTRIYEELKAFVSEHDIHPVIGCVFSLEEASQAYRFIELRNSIGKVLLKLDN